MNYKHMLNWAERIPLNDNESHLKEKSDRTQQSKHMQNLLQELFSRQKDSHGACTMQTIG